MADHGNNYVRAVADNGDGEIGALPPECGHHCGVLTVGNAKQLERHCACKECHNTNNQPY